MRRMLLLIVLLLCVAVVPAQAQSPALTFDYTTSPYTASPYNASYPTPTGYAAPTHVPGSGYRVTTSYLSDGYTSGNRSCVQHRFGGTMTTLTRFVIVTTGTGQSRLSAQFYDSNDVSVYSQFWDSATGTRDVSVSESDVQYATLCITSAANQNNPDKHIVSMALYGVFIPDGVSFDADPLEGGVPLTVTFTNTSSCPDASPGWQWDFDGDTVIDSTDEDPAAFTYSAIGTYFATLTATCNGALDDHTEMITVNGTLTRPLAATDEDQIFGIWDKASRPDAATVDPSNAASPDPNMVIAMSNDSNDPVYSITAGTVLHIQPIVASCWGLFYVPASSDCILRFDANSWVEGAIFSSVRLYIAEKTTFHQVVVSGDDGYIYEYILVNPETYVGVGQRVRAGCIIGETTPLITPGASFDFGFQVDIGRQPAAFAAFISRLDDEDNRLSLLSELAIFPTPGEACNANPDELACIYNPDPNAAGKWFTTGDVTRLQGGIQLSPNAQVYATLPLVDGTSYGARFTIDRLTDNVGSSNRAALQVAGSIEDVDLNSLSLVDVYEVAAAVYDADTDEPTVSITNRSNHNIVITRICVTDGTASARPATCLFDNFSFDAGLTGWDTTGSVTSSGLAGQIEVGNGGTWWQEITLYPDGTTEYVYRIYVKVALPSYWIEEVNTTLRLDYAFGTDSGFMLSPAGSSTYAFGLFNGWAGREVTFAINLGVDAPTTENFYISATVSDSSAATVFIREVCVDDPFGNWDYGGGAPPPFSTNCAYITPPAADDDVGMWIYFHWQNLDRFFQCDLMIKLNQIALTGARQFSMLRWSIQYYQQVALRWLEFVPNSLVPWLNGHLHNIAVGRSTTIISGDQQCDNLFCLLTSGIDILRALIEDIFSPLITGSQEIIRTLINTLSQAPFVLYNILADLISLLLSVVTAIFAAWQSVMRWFGQIISAWNNAEPVTFSFMPTCDVNPQGNAICIILWTIQNTVASGAGALFVPILIGYATIDMIIDAAKRVQKAITRMRA